MTKTVVSTRVALKMMGHGVTAADVEAALATGETIRTYADDKPLPSRLVLGWVNNRALHVVCADNDAAQERIIITAYWPDPTLWTADFRRKV